jgi:hypothetical protein
MNTSKIIASMQDHDTISVTIIVTMLSHYWNRYACNIELNTFSKQYNYSRSHGTTLIFSYSNIRTCILSIYIVL